MMNFVLKHFVITMRMIDQEISICYTKSYGQVPLPLTDEYKARIDGMLQYAAKLFRDMDLTAAENRLVRITQSIKVGTSFQAMCNELKVLKESVEDDITYERFYHYPKKVAEIPIRVAADWAATLGVCPGNGT